MTSGSRGGSSRMTRRPRATVLLAAGLIAGGVAASAQDGKAGMPTAHPAPETALSGLLWPGRPAAPRVDQAGRTLTSASLRDKVVLVAFVSPDCLVTCVVRTLALAELARALPEGLRDRTAFLAVDVGTEADGGAALRGFAEGLGIAPAQMRLVTGDAAAREAVIAALRYPAAALPEPPAKVLLFDRRGQLAMSYGSDPLDGPRLLRDIAQLDTFADGVGHPPREATAEAAP